MKLNKIIFGLITVGGLTFGAVGCDTSSTTNGRDNKGGRVTSGQGANEQRGGTADDWNQGAGAPGSAASPRSSDNQMGSSSETQKTDTQRDQSS